MIIVSGSFRLPADKIADARGPMKAVIETTRGEVGNLAYGYAADVLDPTLFRLTEIWTDAASAQRHLGTAHLGAFLQKMMALGVSDIDLTQHEITRSAPLALG